MIRPLLVATVASLFTCNVARTIEGKQDGVSFKFVMNKPGAIKKWYHPAGQWKFEYFSDTRRYTYEEATQVCADRNSEVATVQSEQEVIYMLHTMKNNRHGFWAGAVRDNNATGVTGPGYGFSWADGGDITYTNWAQGQSNKKKRPVLDEPNSGRNYKGKWDQPCLVIGFNNGNPTWWNDADCDLRRRVVCKRVHEECHGVADASYCAAAVYANIDAKNVEDLRTVQQNCDDEFAEFPGCEPGKTRDLQGNRHSVESCSWTVRERCQIECDECTSTSTTEGLLHPRSDIQHHPQSNNQHHPQSNNQHHPRS